MDQELRQAHCVNPSNNTYYTKVVYDELVQFNIDNPTATTWVSLVKGLLDRCGMGHYWIHQNVSDEKHFKTIFRQRVCDMYKQEWSVEVSLTSTNRLYKHIKETFLFEPYLNLRNKSYRVAIAKVRLSSHLFFIEKGRWGARRIELSERKCSTCDVIEDEYHCLVECPRYVNERDNCLPEGLRKKPSMFEFVKFLKAQSELVQSKLGRLCLKVQLEHRRFL